MKVPLRFQVTEYDCGSVSLLNAISYLFDREDISAELAKVISTKTLDCKDDDGNIGQGGTSRKAIKNFVNYVNEKKYGIKCDYLMKDNITIDKLKDCIKNNGVIVIRCYQSCEHYVLITNIDNSNVYLFDPYYLNGNYYDQDKEVKIILDEPFSYNRIVTIERLLSEDDSDFALGPIDNREVVLINRS